MTDRARKQAFVAAALVVGAAVALLSTFTRSDERSAGEMVPTKPRPAQRSAPVVAGSTAGPADGGMTAAARRFARAYLVYQAGLADRRTWSVLTDTASAAVVQRLRATEIARPPASARPPVGRVGRVAVVHRAAGAATLSVQLDRDTVSLTLSGDGSRWRVTALA